MNQLKLFREDFRKYNPVKGYCGFNYYLHELGIKSNLWPKVWIIMIYLTGKSLNECAAEIYDKQGHAIEQ